MLQLHGKSRQFINMKKSNLLLLCTVSNEQSCFSHLMFVIHHKVYFSLYITATRVVCENVPLHETSLFDTISLAMYIP